MSEPIRMDGQYQTRGGKPVRVLCVDATHTQGNVVALIDVGRGEEPYSFYADGRLLYCIDSDLDLVPVPKKHKRTYWLAHFIGSGGCQTMSAYWSRESALDCTRKNAHLKAITGPHEVEFTEGEGLSPATEE